MQVMPEDAPSEVSVITGLTGRRPHVELFRRVFYAVEIPADFVLTI
jgi:hypothetical protein